MKTYLLSATAVIFLSVIVSLIIPEGKLHKTILFVMRMACILVLIRPVTGIFKIKSPEASEPIYDTEYICKVYSDNQSERLEEHIFKEFGEECDCNVNIEYEEGNFKVSGVLVNLSENSEKINEIQSYLEEIGYINITVYAKSN